MKRKTNNVLNEQFYKFPKFLLHEEEFKDLSLMAKILYMLLKNREQLSLMNKEQFTDNEGFLFIYYDQKELMELLNISNKTIVKTFKELQNNKLIEIVRQGLGKPNKVYILNYEYKDIKKAPTHAQVEAHNISTKTNENNNNTNIKHFKANVNSFTKANVNKKYKVRNNKFNNGTNNTFLNYEEEELELMLLEKQKNKF